jgi:sulfate permease, SulP family
MTIKQFFPIAEWLPNYKKSDIKGDLSAGLTVGVMLIPQGMAYAMLAGLPPIYGLYAATVPLLIYAIFGTSRQLSVGPVAMASLLVASGLATIVSYETEPEQYIKLAVLLALMVGVFRLGMGLFRLGFLVNFLSKPVISGYTSAAALIIGLSQLKHLLGIKIPNSNYVHEVLYHAALNIQSTHIITLAIGIGGIALLLGLKKIKKQYKIDIPGPLAVVALSTVLVWILDLNAEGVSIVGSVPGGFPTFTIPELSIITMQALIPAALTIALVGYMESIAVAKAIQAKHKTYKVSANQELIALGVANIGGALFQAFPVNGGFSRTAVNDQAGARTPLAGVISAVLVILTLLFLTALFYYLPQAVLASIIMVAVFNLIDVAIAKNLWKSNRADFWMLIAAFASTLFIGVVEGILIGVLLSLGMLIFKSSKPHVAELGRVPGTPYYRNIKRFHQLEDRPDILVIRFDAELYFANADFFSETLLQKIQLKFPNLKALILDAGSMTGIDSTGMSAIEDLNNNLKKQNIRWLWCEVKGPLRDSFEKAGMTDKIGRDNFFICIQEAVDALDGMEDSSRKSFALQNNVKN